MAIGLEYLEGRHRYVPKREAAGASEPLLHPMTNALIMNKPISDFINFSGNKLFTSSSVLIML